MDLLIQLTVLPLENFSIGFIVVWLVPIGFIGFKVTQSCLTLFDPMDYTIDGILQARILEWVVFPFSRGSSQPTDRTQVSHIAGRFFTSWATREAQEYWSGSPIPSPGDLPDPGMEPGALHADSLPTELSGRPRIQVLCQEEVISLKFSAQAEVLWPKRVGRWVELWSGIFHLEVPKGLAPWEF